jgi:hypothetical protein
VWPAPVSSNGDNGAWKTQPLCYGARVRLNAGWVSSNIGSFSATNQVIIRAMARYGVINVDVEQGGYKLYLSGSNDSRWSSSDVANLRTIPASAFEHIDTVKPQVSLTGPATGTHGVTASFTVRYLNAGNSNFAAGFWLAYSTNGGTSWTNAASGNISQSSRSCVISFTPPTAGSYLVKCYTNQQYWLMPDPISFTVS